MTLYEELKAGLESMLQAQNDGIVIRSTTIEIPDIPDYSADEIRRVRRISKMTQAMFAKFMGVSVKTVEAWERGVNHPTGPARRLMSFLESEQIQPVKEA